MATNVRRCENCTNNVHVPDDRTGLIHTNNKYVCPGRRDKVAQ